MFSKMPLGFVTVMSTPNARPSTKEIAPDQTTMSRVSPMASKKVGSRSMTFGMSLVSNSCIF